MKPLLLRGVLAWVSRRGFPHTTSQTQEIFFLKIKIAVFAFICFMLTAKVFSQDYEIKNLLDSLETTTVAEKKLELLSNITDYYSLKDLDKAIIYARKGVFLSDKNKNTKWQPRFYEMKGRIHANMIQLDSASFYFSKAEKGYQKIGDKKGQATTYFKIGWVHKKKGELQKALEADLKALKLMESIGDKMGIAGANSRLSQDVLLQGRKQEALDYAKKTIAICEKNNFQRELVFAYTAAGDASIALSNYQQALEYFEKALNEAINQGFDAMSLSDFYNNRGNALKRLGRYPEALQNYKESLRLAQESNYQNALNTIGANLGEINLLVGNYEEALPYQLETIRLTEESGDLPNLPENYMHASTIYEKLGNYPAALEYQKKARIMGDSVAALESDRNMSELLTQYETEKKEQTITTQNAQIAQQKRTQTLYVILAALLAIIVFGMFFILQNIRKKRKALAILNTELDAKNKQNELLLKEIHHRVKNNLEMVKSLIALQSAQLTDTASKEAMLASQNRVQSMGIIHQKLYQGNNLGAIEMKDYFLNLGEGVLDTFNAEQKVRIECAMDELNLDVDTAVPIGLIVNELLTNALKYAFPDGNSGKIDISLKHEKDALQLRVSDNGIGKMEGAVPKGTGFGTQLIRLLTQQLNGTMHEDHSHGTTLLFHFKNYVTA
ncbi:tetratricopeptide repeat protein [Aequorivita echinoideorum]|uniref:histidine kinase n=1 Tax=Aequorivita echinoideorum TaxID=1549647 RepID=A0ABS5S2G0_9FLAO|nr:tetratricopeptide repeat protein [Aequorivita echinoideorum]MBT0607386.1 tetratricopeptide repeat protein [Aequorivita echinoideorum]